MKVISTLVLCVFLRAVAFPQMGRQKLSLYAYNVGFSGITTGLGRAINKDKNQKFLKEFWTGFKHGCIGGTIAFGGKQLAYLIKKDDNLAWGWPSKIVHSYGVSVMENSATHSELFNSLRFPVGFIMVDIHSISKGKVTGKIMPGSLACFIITSANEKFNFSKSALLGTPYFEYSGQNLRNGYALLNTVSVNTAYDYRFLAVEPHELIHNFQVREYLIFNTFFKENKILHTIKKSNSKLIRSLNRIFYLDVPYITPFYHTAFLKGKNYYDNIFELEAQHFATNQYVQH